MRRVTNLDTVLEVSRPDRDEQDFADIERQQIAEEEAERDWKERQMLETWTAHQEQERERYEAERDY